MKSSMRVVSIVLAFFVVTATAADKRAAQEAELEALRAELKPLRQRAYLEPEVIAARKSLDDAYRAYWDAVRAAMVRLEPKRQADIKKEIALRKKLGAVAGGSRAEDYERKAAQAKANATPGASPAKKSAQTGP